MVGRTRLRTVKEGKTSHRLRLGFPSFSLRRVLDYLPSLTLRVAVTYGNRGKDGHAPSN